MRATKVIYSDIMKRWYLQIENRHELEISERDAKMLIEYYGLSEINFNRWELI